MPPSAAEDTNTRAILERLPAALGTRLLHIRPVLEHEGCVQERVLGGMRVYRLRYHEHDPAQQCRRHRSIGLGPDVVIAQCVRDLIALWRERLAFEQERTRERRRQERLEVQETAKLIRTVGRAQGLGWRQVKRAIRQYKYYMRTEPRNVFYWICFSGDFLKPNPRGGYRRRKQDGSQAEFPDYYTRIRAEYQQFLKERDERRNGNGEFYPQSDTFMAENVG